MNSSFSNLIGALFVGIGLAAAGYFVSQTTLNERTGANTAKVKGLSERVVPADTAIWRLSFSTSSYDFNAVPTTFDQAERSLARIQQLLKDAGFTPAEIKASPLRKQDHVIRDQEGKVVENYFSVDGTLSIVTSEPQKIGPARQPIYSLAKEGIDVYASPVDYQFTQLNTIKPDMLREATENARIAANEFAQNAGVRVGGIQNASQGGFQVQNTQIGGGSSKDGDKLVRVVTTITFYLEN